MTIEEYLKSYLVGRKVKGLKIKKVNEIGARYICGNHIYADTQYVYVECVVEKPDKRKNSGFRDAIVDFEMDEVIT